MDGCPPVKYPLESYTVDNIGDYETFNVGITSEEATENLLIAGTIVPADPSKITWSRYSNLFSLEVDKFLKIIADNSDYPFKPNEFQEVLLHCVGASFNSIAVIGTGFGKSEASAFSAEMLRKIHKEPFGIVLVLVPLNVILDEMASSLVANTATIPMSGIVKDGTQGTIKMGFKEEDILAGKYSRLAMHPDAMAVPSVQKLLLKLKAKQRLLAAFVDEVHTVLHWENFRPAMKEQVLRLRAFLRKGAPIVAMTATITSHELVLVSA